MINIDLNLFDTYDFKTYFGREFSYLSDIEWRNTSTYKKGVKVFFNDNFYISLQDNNLNNEPNNTPEYWEIVEDSIYNYIMDKDIEKALGQAKANFNVNLFKNNRDKAEIAFLLLTAHYLVMDLNMANGNGVGNFLITSKSVDGVSASYGIPKKYLENSLYSYLAGSSFGLKYLQYLLPLTVGVVYTINGQTTIT